MTSTREALDQTPIHQGFAIRHNVTWSIGAVIIDDISSLYEPMTLWRHDRARPFSNDECARKQTLTPHLVEAHLNASGRTGAAACCLRRSSVRHRQSSA